MVWFLSNHFIKKSSTWEKHLFVSKVSAVITEIHGEKATATLWLVIPSCEKVNRGHYNRGSHLFRSVLVPETYHEVIQFS